MKEEVKEVCGKYGKISHEDSSVGKGSLLVTRARGAKQDPYKLLANHALGNCMVGETKTLMSSTYPKV